VLIDVYPDHSLDQLLELERGEETLDDGNGNPHKLASQVTFYLFLRAVRIYHLVSNVFQDAI